MEVLSTPYACQATSHRYIIGRSCRRATDRRTWVRNCAVGFTWDLKTFRIVVDLSSISRITEKYERLDDGM